MSPSHHEYSAEVLWQRAAHEAFVDNRYSRRHLLRFDGGLEVPGSSSPLVVPLPLSDTAAVDPEEAFVAALSSCHMLWFLSLAATAGHRVDRYRDQAVGVMSRNASGRLWISTVTLRPEVQFGADPPANADALRQLHQRAHAECFIANSVRSDVRCEPVGLDAPT